MAATEAGAILVSLAHSDIKDALLLSDEARWNQTTHDWAVFIDHGECYGTHVHGRLVASAAILPFSGGFGWISMVLVTADQRRRGIASALMSHCIEAMRQRGAAPMLDATPEGALVYRQLGFRSCCGMMRWRGAGGPAVDQATGASRDHHSAATDGGAILARDREAFGGDRGFLLENFLARPGSELIGSDRSFVVLRTGRRATQIGPLVADDDAEARDLLEAALATVSGPVIVDLLDAGAALRPVLEKHGFEAFRTFDRMVLDLDELPGEPEALMVAAGPEFG